MESSGKKYPWSGSLEVEPETGVLRQEIFKEERDLPGGWGEGRKGQLQSDPRELWRWTIAPPMAQPLIGCRPSRQSASLWV